jgi:hypothetical protein|tara:strand:+ start:1029 stop:1190 length:162 start_codon:yes stop_codon:yes gene_type:complete
MKDREKRMEIRRKEYQQDKIIYKSRGILPMILIIVGIILVGIMILTSIENFSG